MFVINVLTPESAVFLSFKVDGCVTMSDLEFIAIEILASGLLMIQSTPLRIVCRCCIVVDRWNPYHYSMPLL